MKRLCTLALAGLLALALAPATAATTTAKTAMPTCKGRMVMTDTTTHTYATNMHWKVSHHKMMVMCEAGAKAKGYHMMTSGSMKSTHMTTKKPAMPVVNPSGALNTDKGATPNPDNNANGVHTTANPAPTPTP
jgi:hypothetical protein